MLIFVDMDHVNKVLAAHGLSVKFRDSADHPWQILATTKEASWGEGEFLVGYHLLGRLAAEFLRLDWMLKNRVYGSIGDEVRNKLREANALYA
jgi:hypothetical protein